MRKPILPFLILLFAAAALAQQTDRQIVHNRNAADIAGNYTPQWLGDIAKEAAYKPSGSPAEQFAHAKSYFEPAAQLQAWLQEGEYRDAVLAGGADEQAIKKHSTDAAKRLADAAVLLLTKGGDLVSVAGDIRYLPISITTFSPRAKIATYALVALDFGGVGDEAFRTKLEKLGGIIPDPDPSLPGYQEMMAPVAGD
ncbi:MAG TPA: hypothetical protein VNN25_12615 [Thermoanaerobaculia bacterium]|nr:hypothetical protein [Thermoanaerobaculia bacterium]